MTGAYEQTADHIDWGDRPPLAPVPDLIVLRADEAIDAPSPAEVIQGIVWAGCVTVLAAESGAGKTFVLLDLGAAVSAGLSWHGRQTTQGSTVYLGFEGDAIGRRLRALRDVGGHHLEHLYVVRVQDAISPRITREGEEHSSGEMKVRRTLRALREDLAATGLPPVRLLIVDTVRASMTGNEDSSEPVSAYQRAVRRIMAEVPDAGAILSHHAGWQDGDTARKRERGSSAWRGNSDGSLYLEGRDPDPDTGDVRLTLRTLKVRDAEKPRDLYLVRRSVELPGEIDRYGQPVTSCVIEADRSSHEDRKAERLAVLDQQHTDTDRQTLKVVVDRPDLATSQDAIRAALGTRKLDVSQSLARLVRAGYVNPGTRKQPYTVTPEGLAWIRNC